MTQMRVIKTYGHTEGWSCTFRQWRAESHCRFIHGYAIGVELEFRCLESECDANGWVIDFGGLKDVKAWLKELLDHKTLIAADDPALPLFQEHSVLRSATSDEGGYSLFDLKVLEGGVGCDNLAKYIASWITEWLEVKRETINTKAWLHRVRVSEHAGNSAEWSRS